MTVDERMAVALERISNAVSPVVIEEPAPLVGCQHPIEDRIDFGVTNGQPDWECGVCHARSLVLEVRG